MLRMGDWIKEKFQWDLLVFLARELFLNGYFYKLDSFRFSVHLVLLDYCWIAN